MREKYTLEVSKSNIKDNLLAKKNGDWANNDSVEGIDFKVLNSDRAFPLCISLRNATVML